MPSVKFGGPFEGYVSSIAKHVLKPGNIASLSTNVLINPFDGSVYRRAGSTVVGDTLSGGNEVTGLLEQKFSSKCRKIGDLDSPSFTDGLPVPSALVTKESNSSSFPTVDTGFFGQQYARDIAGSNNYSWLSEFAVGHYPNAGGAGQFDLIVVPLWYESGEGGYTRGATKFTRRFLCPGSRSWLDTEGWRYLPNLRGTPCRWNRRLNVSAVAGGEAVRICPSGPFGPMFPPTIAAGTASAGSDAAWLDGDTFYFSVMFQFEDGSYSLPFIPRSKNARLTSGLGFKTIGTIAGGAKYANINWTNIPIGPDGTIARVLLRSPKQTLAAATDTLTISYGNMQICGILRNNTQTSFVDTLGNDAGLLDDVNLVRFDWVAPRRARSIGSGDQRALIGYTLPSPCGIRVAPTGSVASRDLNLADTGSIVGALNFLVRVTSTQVEFHKIAVGAAPTFGGGGNGLAFTYATYTTLQDLVDAINATTVASNCGEWCADLAPGVDGTLASSSLCQSVTTLAGCSASGSTLTTASDTTLPLGYEIYDSNGKIPAGTYLQTRESATSFTMSAAATGAINASQIFYANTGDNCLTAGNVGYLRAFAASVPVHLYLKRSAQVGYSTPDKRSVYFTVSSPGAAAIGVSLAANAWASSNRRQPEGVSGSLMAITGIEDAAVLEYSRSRHLFVNRRGVTSGEDFDYRVVPINLRRGALDSRSCVAVNNAAVCVTKQGIAAADKSMREVVLSNDVHNPSPSGSSSLLLELTQCLAGAQGDSDTGVLAIAHLGTQLHVCYRVAGTGSSPNRRLVYDFSPGAEASGIAGLLTPDGRTFPWSAPFTKGYSAMCEVARDVGIVRYGWSDTNLGSTGDGRIDVIDDASAGGLDNGSSYSASVYSAQLIQPGFSAFMAKRFQLVCSTLNGSQISLWIDRGHITTSNITTPATTGTYGNPIVEVPLASRGNGQCIETLIALTTDGDILWQYALDYDLVDAWTAT